MPLFKHSVSVYHHIFHMNVKKAFCMWCTMTILFAFCILGSELFVLNKGGSWCNTKVSTLQPSGHGFKIAETTSLLAGVR